MKIKKKFKLPTDNKKKISKTAVLKLSSESSESSESDPQKNESSDVNSPNLLPELYPSSSLSISKLFTLRSYFY